jgi:hypothetical protein
MPRPELSGQEAITEPAANMDERIWHEMKPIRKQNSELKQLVRTELQNSISVVLD